MAEMEGFEPPHALRRLPDFESGPFSHLGTSPSDPICPPQTVKSKPQGDCVRYYDIFSQLLQEKYLRSEGTENAINKSNKGKSLVTLIFLSQSEVKKP